MLFLLSFSQRIYSQPKNSNDSLVFTKRIIAENLKDPWAIVYGPDDYLWVVESKKYLLSRIHLETKKKTVLKDFTPNRNFSGEKSWPMGGLMGLALHPDFTKGKPFVYVAYVYQFNAENTEDGCKDNFGGCFYKIKLERYQYDKTTQELKNPFTICDTIPGSSDHNGGDLKIAHINNKPYLFYSTGDMGAGQYGNAGRKNRVQDINSYEGKILRFNLEPDSTAVNQNSWIPKDNPFSAEKRNAVWTYGHRNPEGIAEGKINGKYRLYSSEHGPFGDDEVNQIKKGKNYGHPLVIGYNDGNYNGFAAGVSNHDYLPGKWNTAYPLVEDESENAKKMGQIFEEPIKVLGLISSETLSKIFEHRLKNEDGPDWEAVAPSSIAVYDKKAIPSWQNSLLIPSLKQGELLQLKLNKKGHKIIGEPKSYFKGEVRYREVEVSPDGSKIYLTTDYSSQSSNPSKNNKNKVNCKGCIIEYTIKNE
ncbi:PQQ-dependent sugar dehydrogenase [Zunongwangia sp. HGR-M22]|uniref:PQQ-dependent sugar dehydrogenase n=1 Tax=Zunongwangia sp. HGR-M22 TaxID=3015168 RepID=UPI0022DD2252|nr:PQQ-dependent sugar dehydrogenase [Zunongwangia sp. HGR-M22]WBL25015.1 PQQ-dependent sugar dehydrogenase [Zunongwangia sp. HGR-M22]